MHAHQANRTKAQLLPSPCSLDRFYHPVRWIVSMAYKPADAVLL